MTDSYDNELSDAASAEKNIDQKIAESRTRIADLVSESQQMIKKLRGEIPEAPEKEYGVIVARVKARAARTKSIIEEKQEERVKLVEDSKKTRKTKSVVSSKGKFSKKVAKKRK